MGVGKATHDQIHLADAAVPGAEQDLAAAGIEAVARAGRAGHEFLNDERQKPGRAGRRLYRGGGAKCQRSAVEPAGQVPAIMRCLSPAHPRIAWSVRASQHGGERLRCAMRPPLLNPFFAALSSLPGVGPKHEKLYGHLLGRGEATPRILDLLFHMPTGAIDRRARPKLRDVVPGTVVTVAVTVDRHRPSPPHRARAPYLVYASDETGALILTFFSARKDYLDKLLPVGAQRYVSGTTQLYDGMLQMVHPDRVVDEAGLAKLPLVEPVYPLTEGLGLNQLRKAADAALSRVPDLPEWQDARWVSRERFPRFADALRALHRPAQPADVEPEGTAWTRLAYDELLAGQLALMLVRAHLRRPAGRATPGTGHLRKKLIDILPYSLTPSQNRAVSDVVADLAKPERMLRLLQGDVGSGKTMVALLAAAAVIEGGRQAAIMAPTEILARQHFNTIAPFAEAIGVNVAILTGRERGRERADILQRLALGDIQLLIGTHAVFQEDVEFRDLALAVVDEQHRFGVHQRLALAKKGEAVDVLVMTATPIPRTLVLTYFGDMDISELREKPAGRQAIDTRTLPLERFDEVVEAVGRALAEGRRVYWVCPLVDDSEKIDLAAAEERFEVLKKRFGATVDLVHGRIKGAEKDRVMERFASGETRLLVATTVIEVGVDVPEATVMVIEHAERFGLSQLHQLRGRIGRGSERSTCLLLYKAPLGKPPRRVLPFCAKPRTASALPRRTCGCAEKATCWAHASPACPASGSRASTYTAS